MTFGLESEPLGAAGWTQAGLFSCILRGIFYSRKPQALLLRPSTDKTRPTHIWRRVICFIQSLPIEELITSVKYLHSNIRLVHNQTAGPHGSDKLTITLSIGAQALLLGNGEAVVQPSRFQAPWWKMLCGDHNTSTGPPTEQMQGTASAAPRALSACTWPFRWTASPSRHRRQH